MRELLRAVSHDLKSPSGYLVICALGVIGFTMVMAVQL
jgi:hypothetical protein